MKYDPETLCLMISLELNRFPRAGDHWELCDPRWPDMVAIKVAQLGEQYISVNGEDFYKWLHNTPKLTWDKFVLMLARKQKQLNRPHTRNNGKDTHNH